MAGAEAVSLTAIRVDLAEPAGLFLAALEAEAEPIAAVARPATEEIMVALVVQRVQALVRRLAVQETPGARERLEVFQETMEVRV